MPYTSMPAWPKLSDGEVNDVLRYMERFYPGFADSGQAAKPIDLPSAPAFSKAAVEKGKQLYETLGCARCHRDAGRGEGRSAPTLRDDKGDRIRAADLTQRWTFRGGPTREDIFRTFSTGLNGIPMPSFFDSLKTEERWALTDYVFSLGESDTPGYTSVVVAAPLEEDVDLARAEALFRRRLSPACRWWGRSWSPGGTSRRPRRRCGCARCTTGRGSRSKVRWRDMQADTTGPSGPALEVPAAETPRRFPPRKSRRSSSAPA